MNKYIAIKRMKNKILMMTVPNPSYILFVYETHPSTDMNHLKHSNKMIVSEKVFRPTKEAMQLVLLL
jgi:hypothetical protein